MATIAANFSPTMDLNSPANKVFFVRLAFPLWPRCLERL
jgi:hypothetical protein